ncbi:MAG TPA: hypothetical protein PK323_13570 [Bacteroidia bacterium]|nr:hypothetical protein [Bacteroidia bacterium]
MKKTNLIKLALAFSMILFASIWSAVSAQEKSMEIAPPKNGSNSGQLIASPNGKSDTDKQKQSAQNVRQNQAANSKTKVSTQVAKPEIVLPANAKPSSAESSVQEERAQKYAAETKTSQQKERKTAEQYVDDFKRQAQIIVNSSSNYDTAKRQIHEAMQKHIELAKPAIGDNASELMYQAFVNQMQLVQEKLALNSNK